MGVVKDRESIKRYITDYYRYKKSSDIESVYILLYIREDKKLLDKFRIITDSYSIPEEDFIELCINDLDEIGYKVTYKRGNQLIDKSLVILEKLKEQEKLKEVNIYIRLDVLEVENLVESNESCINVFSEEDLIEIKDDYIESIRINESVKVKINDLLDAYTPDLNKELYELVILQKESERDMLDLLRKYEISQVEIVRN